MMQRRAFLSLSLPVLSGTLPSRAQEAPTFRTETLVVEVLVVVRDRRGKAPVDDLQREDFELLVNGKPVPIEWFSVAHAGRGDRETDSPPALPEGFVRNRASDQAESGRVVALVVDTLNARFDENSGIPGTGIPGFPKFKFRGRNSTPDLHRSAGPGLS